MTNDELLQARRDAIARGDKALGREIYHHLQEQGLTPAEIDASTFDAPPAVAEPEPEVEQSAEDADWEADEVVEDAETETAVPAPMEKAVKEK